MLYLRVPVTVKRHAYVLRYLKRKSWKFSSFGGLMHTLAVMFCVEIKVTYDIKIYTVLNILRIKQTPKGWVPSVDKSYVRKDNPAMHI